MSEIDMFDEPAKPKKPEKLDDECAFWLTLYCEWSHSVANINKSIDEGMDEAELNRLKFRHKKLENRLDNEWLKLSDEQRTWLFWELIEQKEIPEKAGEILELFKGKVVSLKEPL